jgi:hypothetical protein
MPVLTSSGGHNGEWIDSSAMAVQPPNMAVIIKIAILFMIIPY